MTEPTKLVLLLLACWRLFGCAGSSGKMQHLYLLKPVCWRCLSRDQIDDVTNITMINQNFTNITRSQMSLFPNLRYLVIDDSPNFEQLENDTFQENSFLKKVVIGRSNLTKASWLWLRHSVHIGTTIPEFDLTNAPLACACENFWIRRWRSELRETMIIGGGATRQEVNPPVAEYLRLPIVRTSGCTTASGEKVNWDMNDFTNCPKLDVRILSPRSYIVDENQGIRKFTYTLAKHGNETYNVSVGIKDVNQVKRHSLSYSIRVVEKRVKFEGDINVTYNFDANVNNSDVPELWVAIELEQISTPPESDGGYFPSGPFIDMGLIVLMSKPTVTLTKAAVQSAGITFKGIKFENVIIEVRGYPQPNLLEINGRPIEIGCHNKTCKKIDTDVFTRHKYLVRIPVSQLNNGSVVAMACNVVGCSFGKARQMDPAFPHTNRLDYISGHYPHLDVQTKYSLYFRELWLFVTLATFAVVLVVSGFWAAIQTYRNHSNTIPMQQLCESMRESIPVAIQTELVVGLTPNPTYSRLPQDIRCIPDADLELLDQVGEGAFGIVYEAVWYPGSSKSGTRVAVKGLKAGAGRKEREEFEREAMIMNKLKHESIIKLFGVCPGPNLYLIFEFMDQGDLKSFLMLRGPNRHYSDVEASYQNILTVTELLDMAQQLSHAMTFLAQNRFVHRDVAARNCLMSDPLKVKLGDFGLSRDIYVAQYYKLSRDALLPVRWLAPESVSHGRFTIESDVWSFGILLWEIFSYGELPWSDMDSSTVLKSLKSGEKLHSPRMCPYPVYELMLKCWKVDPTKRMKMVDIHSRLQELHKKY